MATQEQMEDQLEFLIDNQVKYLKQIDDDWIQKREEGEKILMALIDKGIAIHSDDISLLESL